MLLQEPITGNFLAQIFPIVLLMGVGFLLLTIWAFWIMSKRSQKKDEQGQEDTRGGAGFLDSILGSPSESPSSAPSNMVAAPAQTVAATHTPPPQMLGDDSVEVFRVLRDLADGSLVVEIDGMRYGRLVDITDAQVGRRFVANARALAHFAMLLKGEAPPAPPPEMPAPAPPPAMEPPPAPAPPPPTAVTGRRASSTPQPAEPVPMRPIQSLRRQQSSDEDEPPAELISVADEIEELLQYRLAQHPMLARRSIHVRPNITGGVRIEVEGAMFEAVDEVPDSEIRGFLQETIQEWNARN